VPPTEPPRGQSSCPGSSEGIVDVRLEQANSEDWAALAGPDWNDATSLYKHLSENTNHIKAAKLVPWDDILPAGSIALDLGCGSGWLAAMLTQHANVDSVIAWDASQPLLAEVLPTMFDLMGGDMSKVQRVCGLFSPLPLHSSSIDIVVMSSAFHHSADPDGLLGELIRVLKPGGAILLLNEVPYAVASTFWAALSTAAAAVVNCVGTGWTITKRGHVAADHVLCDEVLGDRAMTPAQWRRLFRRHGLAVEILDTSLPPYPRSFRRQYLLEANLTHFVLRPCGADAPESAVS
jgi:ubiquinone/menaquinone biosynthesis C-methylase UbiE